MSQAGSGSCEICRSKTSYYFSKTYPAYAGSPFDGALNVNYWKCKNCGFVISETHRRMTPEQWYQLNSSWHHMNENAPEARTTNQPPYAEQALALQVLGRNGAFALENGFDYAAGYGTLARLLKKYFSVEIRIFDRYVASRDHDLKYVAPDDVGRYPLVINSAMFEHVLDRAALDEVNDLVSPDGVLMLHTVVCERVPNDPDWFYIKPIVHTAFHTNKSMSLLMKQWGYAASIYCPLAKSWFLFKDGYPGLGDLEGLVARVNAEIQTGYVHYKAGFVDYWKGF